MNGRQRVFLNVLPLTLLLGYFLLTSCQSSAPTAMNSGKLAESVEPPPFEPVLVWEREQVDGCHTIAIDTQGQARFGACSGPLSTTWILSDVERLEDLHHFLNSFQSFNADTPAGRVNFSGRGEKVAEAPEQRALAEWAFVVYQEALYGRSGASWGMGMTLNREGDNPCQLIQIEIYGKVMANDCRKGIHPYPRVWLTAEHLDRLYGWIDKLQSAELSFQGKDGQPMRFIFGGKGNQAVTNVELQEMLSWVETLYGTMVK